MNSKFRNEILIEGYLYDKDLENKSFKIKNDEDIIVFRYNADTISELINELKSNETIRVKGSFDKDDDGVFLLARGILVMPNFVEGEY